jgi:hypothetical protein
MDRQFSSSVSETDTLCVAPRTARRTERQARAVFAHAVARCGCAEHEWLNPDVDSGSAFDMGTARVLVLPDRCMASTDDRTLELTIEIAAGRARHRAQRPGHHQSQDPLQFRPRSRADV